MRDNLNNIEVNSWQKPYVASEEKRYLVYFNKHKKTYVACTKMKEIMTKIFDSHKEYKIEVKKCEGEAFKTVKINRINPPVVEQILENI